MLARYVQMATDGGVVQAVYPEGGLSRDGRLREPRLGLLSYMVGAFDPASGRDLVFIPVGINYDRVLEDRTLLRSLDKELPRAARVLPWREPCAFSGIKSALLCGGAGIGLAMPASTLARPISMTDYLADAGTEFAADETPERFEQIETLGRHLMEAVGAVIPVTPVALVVDRSSRKERPSR